jgi:hypothetical protein
VDRSYNPQRIVLVAKPDRRQTPDRRRSWRGGRRETDQISFPPRLAAGAEPHGDPNGDREDHDRQSAGLYFY